jgi:hypothetical protein
MTGYYQDGADLKCYKTVTAVVGKYQERDKLVDCPKGCNDDKTGCRYDGAKGDTELKCSGKCIKYFKDWDAVTNKKCDDCVTNASLKAPDNKLCECTAKRW